MAADGVSSGSIGLEHCAAATEDSIALEHCAAATEVTMASAAADPPSATQGDVEEDAEVLLAPVALRDSIPKVGMRDFDTGPRDFVLRCTEGIFQGRFIYINRSASGELFGSDGDCKDITMYIENAGVSPKHAEIRWEENTSPCVELETPRAEEEDTDLYSRALAYSLRDSESIDGTWVRLRWDRSVEIDAGQELKIGDTLLEVRKGSEMSDEHQVRQWLLVYKLPHLAKNFFDAGLTSLEDIRALGKKVVDVLHIEEHEAEVLLNAMSEFDYMFPRQGYLTHTVELVLKSPQDGENEKLAVFSWTGGQAAFVPPAEYQDAERELIRDPAEASALPRIQSVPVMLKRFPKRCREDVTVGVFPATGWKEREMLRVIYFFGKYYVHLSEKSEESTQMGWARLRRGQVHWLQPDDMFQIGALVFKVLRFNAGVYSAQGYRATMEDEEIIVQDFSISNVRHCSYFAIYDGHGGRECVTYVRRHLHANFLSSLYNTCDIDHDVEVNQHIVDCLTESFRETDREFLAFAHSNGGSSSGCAAVSVIVVGGMVYCANVGDSRAILSREGRAIQLSLDHKPDREDEERRIVAAGGFVSYRRVMGRLAVSRAFGDEEYKVIDKDLGMTGEPLVIPDPEIRVERLLPEDEFLFLACDGLFDVFSSQEAIGFIHARLAAMPPNEQDPERVVQDIVHEAIHERRSRDNVTAMLVTFKRSISQHSLHR
eukprot:TRINITY_DN1760_c0_g1_i1.p1 TRINITY_DN1760_c0_g1~~TRINITY_DN1760_c0_g1_i1.p1  ORF type:complete len:714 (-),score=140.90 TRINITY_DN1760_c0_g1_i1:139-2280(-)